MAGSASYNVISGLIQDKGAREDFNKIIDGDRKFSAKAGTDYIKNATPDEVNAAKSVYVQFKDGKARSLHDVMVEHGLTERSKRRQLNEAERQALQDSRKGVDTDTGLERNSKVIGDEIDRIDNQRNNNTRAISGIKGGIGKNATKIGTNAEGIQANKDAIEDLTTALIAQGEAYQEALDGTKASMHAIANARPIATNVGKAAVGVGVGASGNKQAVAIGASYRFNENWSSSTTINMETAGKYTKEDVSAGVGVHFAF
ncbi:hypothetical protein JCM19241_3284 [Vibrio ishigakensis]|uniref:Trimeric autotransporter adhesin YadA-like C-terminal membrane anchor domain-containing protein n=1 Tax=Vibrio ishigakensis TaxID=1481914 RepID=A0A0B8QEE4_9VIBR|nr:hypothetical protein JCM19241_3284 [Vibrio ishigakensis]